jgi:hypothetical protein
MTPTFLNISMHIGHPVIGDCKKHVNFRAYEFSQEQGICSLVGIMVYKYFHKPTLLHLLGVNKETLQ